MFTLLAPGMSQAEFVVPPLVGPVIDRPRILPEATMRELDFAIRRMHDVGGPQFNVVIVESLEGTPIESATMKIAEAWKLGHQRRDDGVILLVAMQDRKIRIEVGQGLEGALTDVESKRIIEDQMVPFFRQGRPEMGILIGARAVMSKIAPQNARAEFLPPPSQLPSKSRGELPFPVLLMLIFFGLLMTSFKRRGKYRRFRGYDPRRSAGGWTSGGGSWSGGGGGFSGGSSGGGGWSGGGGGFSGGGASGGW